MINFSTPPFNFYFQILVDLPGIITYKSKTNKDQLNNIGVCMILHDFDQLDAVLHLENGLVWSGLVC